MGRTGAKNSFDFTMNEETIKIYIGKPRESVRVLPILEAHLGVFQGGNRLFRNIFKQVSFPFFSLVESPGKADFLLIPHDYFNVHKDKEYLDGFVRLSFKHRKKLVVFVYGDSDEVVSLPNATILRTSQYRYKHAENEILMPGYTEDLLFDTYMTIRGKSEKPTVGFCGWADFQNIKSALRFWLKVLLQNIRTYILQDSYAKVYTQGIFFRKKALKYLEQSPLVNTNFIIRRSYSGHKNTIELPEEQARLEYIQNMIDSDFILCVKGDGNWSYRFYETLSCGRLPVLVDTDISLPLEDIIPYEEFIVRIPWNRLDSIPAEIHNFYESLSEDRYRELQRMARNVFTNYLRIDSFLAIVFKRIAQR
jgi:hypothetical protein